MREHTNRKWLLKVGPLVAVGAAVLIGCSGGASDTPSESMARAILEASGAVKSGALKIDSFTKTNGLKREQNGVEQYEFDYKVEVSFPKGVMPQCVDTSHFDLVCNSASISGMKPKKVGAQETHTGKILFEKAENGWRSVSHEPDDA